jgi:hypothetical protein
MAISAYRGGRLKKRALLGTSLAADPTRAAEREQFRGLHQEAKSHAGDPEGFKKRVAARFAKQREAGLGAIERYQGRIGSLERQTSALEQARSAARGDIAIGEERVGGLTTALSKEFKKKSWIKRMLGKGTKGAMKLGMKPGKLMKKAMKGALGAVGGMASAAMSPGNMAQAALLKGGKGNKRARRRAEYLKQQMVNQGSYEDFQNFVAEHAAETGKLAGVKDYRDYVSQRETAAREAMPGIEAGIEERRGKIGEFQESIESTYRPLAARAKLYSGFFGGA